VRAYLGGKLPPQLAEKSEELRAKYVASAEPRDAAVLAQLRDCGIAEELAVEALLETANGDFEAAMTYCVDQQEQEAEQDRKWKANAEMMFGEDEEAALGGGGSGDGGGSGGSGGDGGGGGGSGPQVTVNGTQIPMAALLALLTGAPVTPSMMAALGGGRGGGVDPSAASAHDAHHDDLYSTQHKSPAASAGAPPAAASSSAEAGVIGIAEATPPTPAPAPAPAPLPEVAPSITAVPQPEKAEGAGADAAAAGPTASPTVPQPSPPATPSLTRRAVRASLRALVEGCSKETARDCLLTVKTLCANIVAKPSAPEVRVPGARIEHRPLMPHAHASPPLPARVAGSPHRYRQRRHRGPRAVRSRWPGVAGGAGVDGVGWHHALHAHHHVSVVCGRG